MTILKKTIISAVIPTYNREKYVTNAIDSVLAQTFYNYEIIVIDDGSTDNTRKVLSSYGNKIRYFFQENKGVSAARNLGVEKAKGEWIAFLDSDDEWLPGYLSCQMEHARQYPQVCTHITNSFQIAIDGKKINTFQDNMYMPHHKFKRTSCLIVERPLSFVIKCHITNLPATIMRRDVLLSTGLFNTNLNIAEDLDMIARMALEGALGVYNKALVYTYRRNEPIENLTKQLFSIYSGESFGKVYKNLRNQLNLTFSEKYTLNQVLSSNRRAVANLFLKRGEIQKARDYYKEALIIYPSIASLSKYLLSFFPSKVAKLFVRQNCRNN